ncbi:cobalamin B12-binding domain-containing protein [Sulfitobacter aestuariivivens]|uniref:Cobalamin B12-binding domain-containing protein n=1 Tax=Sulfitobacter aestuariivivens TaxID=2766981 RepID=A0A927D960_9RHOB|nr:cobalamin-dependent protein [Sulfitobacter aestuariivivens]MBD3665041.1 cobalamin B12-binding domain-containing protein [Sulfitobacter aestuariivivens]
MTDSSDDSLSFSDDVYNQTFAKVTSLRNILPKNSVEMLAREVILRLQKQSLARQHDLESPSPEKIALLSRALMSRDAQAGIDFVHQIRADGATAETVYLVYLQSAALQLGTWWEQDRISFVDVTIGTGHIYAIMRGLRPLFVSRDAPSARKTALFACVPGEDHHLGISMAADLFRNSGWDIDLKTDLDHDALVDHAHQTRAAVVGVSAASDRALPHLAKLVVALNINQPESAIVVSGNICAVAGKAIDLMDVDGQAHDFRSAQEIIESLWQNRQISTLR